jgi:pyruvate-formate lyase-activating enzyme
MNIYKKEYSEDGKKLTIYVQGCNLRCADCKDLHLVPKIKKENFNKEDINYKNLKEITIRGGEATLQTDLVQFLKYLQNNHKNIVVKLYTNGVKVSKIYKITNENLVDKIYLVLKNSFLNYHKNVVITGGKDWKCIYKSALFIKNSNIDFEFCLKNNLQKDEKEIAKKELEVMLKEKIHI